jgi:hypothetical protein
VALVVSGLPGAIFGPAASVPAAFPAASVTDTSQADSTNTDEIIVAFTKPSDDPAAKASAAVRRTVAAIGAKVVKAEALNTTTAAVTLNKELTRSQANAVAASVEKLSGVKYAEGSMTFYPTSVGTPTVADYQWNLKTNPGVNATDAWNTATGAGVRVGVIDTGIADNAQLPKSLTLYSTNGKTITGTTWPGLTVTVTNSSHSNSDVCTATADTTGVFGCDPTATPAHQDVLTATINDAANTNTTVTVDSNLDSLAVSPYFTTSSAITGTAELGATVVVGSAGSCSTAASSTDLVAETFSCPVTTDGSYTITATDALGNTATATTTVDTKTPDAPVITSPADGSTLGDSTPTVSGTGEAGATITVTDSTGKPVCTATVAEDGNWTCTPGQVADGTYTVHATQTDKASNASAASNSITVTIDTTIPSAVIISAPVADAVLNNASPALTGTGEAGANVTVTEPGSSGSSTTVCSATVAADSSWSCTPTTKLAEGTHTLSVTQTDKAKHTSTATTVTFTVDTVAPDAPSVTTATETLVSGTAEADSTITISYTLADGTALSPTAVANSEGSWSATLTQPAPVGATISVTATDLASNVSAAATAVIAASPSPSPSPSPTPTDTPTATPDPSATASETPDATETSSDSGTMTGSNSGTSSASPSTSSVTTSRDTVTSKTSTVGAVLPGYDFVNGDANAEDLGDSVENKWHGTHVAGIVAATSTDSSHPSGVAPDAEIVPIRAITGDGGDMADVAKAIAWAAGGTADNVNPDPVDVINLSLGGVGDCSQTLQSAIDGATGAGIPVVVSAGNKNTSIENYAPANCRGVIVVTATTNTGARASYSNWGTSSTSQALLVAAPGGASVLSAGCSTWGFAGCEGIVSTIGGTGGRLQAISGTSQAAPHVTGVIALMKQKNQSLSISDITTVIRGTASRISDGCATAVCGSGIVNAAEALTQTPASGSTVSVAPAASTNPAPISFTTNLPATSKVGATVGVTAASGYPALSYQWYRSGNTLINGATNSWYALTAADAGYMYVKAYPAGEDPSSSTAVATLVMKVNPGTIWVQKGPSISGTKRVGKTLKSTRGTWSVGVSVKYQWLRNGKTIKKATKSSYRLTRSDRGKRISVRLTVSQSGYYSRTATSAKTSTIRR